MQSQPANEVYTARPRRLQLITGAFGMALLVLAAVGWYGLPSTIRALFTFSQVLTLLVILASILFVIGVIASSYVRADSSGLLLRNGLRTHVIGFERELLKFGELQLARCCQDQFFGHRLTFIPAFQTQQFFA